MKFSLLLTMVAGLAFSQAKTQDVTGWAKIKWGMTIEDVRSAYPGATGDGTRERLFLEPVQIGDLSMNVSVSARTGTDRITKIELSNMDGGSRKFDGLKVLLIQKYGAPINEATKSDEANASVTTLLWTFPSASITLALRRGRGIYLEYTATDKEALDLL